MKRPLRLLLPLLCSILTVSCSAPKETKIGTPKIKAGTAKITGQVMSSSDKKADSNFVEIFVPHTISGEIFKYKTPIDAAGKFAVDIDVETDISLIGLYTTLKPHNALFVKVQSDDVTNIAITYNQSSVIEDVETKPEMNKYDMMQASPLINEMVGIYDDVPDAPQVPLYDKSPETYLTHVKSMVSEKLEILDKDSVLSKDLKGVLADDFRIWRYRLQGFNYEASMKNNYKYTAPDTNKTLVIQKIDKSFFSFLKEFDLNNPQHLLTSSFSDFQKEILKNKTLALPEIGERDIPSWLAEVKAVLSDVVGFKDGQYYDVLAANAYGRQLIDEAKPLTEKQKKNIAEYWKDGEIAKILLRKNALNL